MATTAEAMRLGGLAQRLVREGVLSEEEAAAAQAEAQQKKIPLVTHLVASGKASPLEVARAGSLEFGIPYFDLDALLPEMLPREAFKEKILRKHQVLPIFRRGNRLYVALVDPLNLAGLDELKFATGMFTEPVLVEEDKLTRLLDAALEEEDPTSELGDLSDEDLENLEVGEEEPQAGNEVAAPDVDDTPIVRFVNKILLDAVKKKASDIHFEPYEKKYRVRLRIDGVLQEVASPPVTIAHRIAARLKVMSRLDIAERRVPQDGRIKLQLSKNRAVDLRVNTLPTLFGEKIVLRILDSSAQLLSIDALGYEDDQKRLYLEALAKPYGMILVTGPTGSGKTVSLYTGLSILNTTDRNISTAEDPAEINLPGINQVNVNPKVGLTFAEALRAFLRQDPDVIMVGEIRDLETAEIAIKAAQTGHLVLSTLHTNDAPQTLTRLVNMGVPTYNIASSVSLIIAQRLARRLCPNCKAPADIPEQALFEEGFTEQMLEDATIYKAVGCDQCTNGYKGRTGIYQVMPVSEEMGRIIMSGGNAIQLADQARKEGVADLRTSGLKKVAAGITSIEEVNRVTTD